MSTTLSHSALPLLSARAALHPCPTGLVVDADECTLTFEGAGARVLQAVQAQLDGTHRLATLAREDLRLEDISAVLGVLAEEGLVLDAAAAPEAGSMARFQEAYAQECQFWTREISAQPFWQALLAGTAPRAVVLGWGIEFFHYVEAANEHMAMAVAQCRSDGELRRWLADHYADEYDHSGLFLQGLVACGLEREQVLEAPPLASTRALINHLTEAAATDLLGYLGAFGLMQSNREGMTRKAVDAFYDQLTGLYPFAAGMFRGIHKHATLDLDLDHRKLVLERLCARPGLDPAVVAGPVMEGVRSAAEHFILFFEGILTFYAGPGAPVPRRPVNVRALS